QPNAESDRSATFFALNYNRRPADTTTLVGNLRAGIFMRTAKREVTYSADTTYYKARQLGANIKKWLKTGPLNISGKASFNYFFNDENAHSSLKSGNWALIKTEGKAVFQPVSFVELFGNAAFTKRGGSQQYLLGANVAVSILNNLKMSAGYAVGTRMPSLQELYWQSERAEGNAGLVNEEISEMHIQLSGNIFSNTSAGIRTQLKQVGHGIMLVDSTFTNVNAFGSLSSTAWFNYNGSLFEFCGSATYHQFGNFLKEKEASFPLDKDGRVWLKAGAYVKGYLFDRATYVKVGLNGIFSPQPYRAAHYFTALDYWQPKSKDALIPSFHRLDFDLSARIRTIMITLRYENILNNVFQQGYFETANYPMNRRRLIFGIKVLFRN
ncbi:MAG TPA: putative porin, partial [Balneolaceae bacterium]|nr:putative porin [Balneolaceae bacterium]